MPLYKIWQHSVDQKQMFSDRSNEIIIDRNLSDGVHVFGKVILIKQGNSFQLLLSKCSHLGCQINKTENDQLVCPCHGSRYNLKGDALKGPATNPLAVVDFDMEKRGENILIRFNI